MKRRIIIPKELCYECDPLTGKKKFVLKELAPKLEYRSVEIYLGQTTGGTGIKIHTGGDIEGGDYTLIDGPNGEVIGRDSE